MNHTNHRFKIKTIQTRLFLIFMVLIIIMISTLSISLYLNQKKMLFNQAKEKAFSLTRTLAYASPNAILDDDYFTLQLLIDSMSDNDDIIYIRIIDTQGTVIAANEVGLRGTKLDDELTLKARVSTTFLLQKDLGKSRDDLWDTAVPINNLEKRIGTARINFTVENTFAGLQKTILLIGLLALAVSLVLSYLLAGTFTKPIHQAIRLANEYGKGNFDASLELNRNDEVGQLVSSLNLLSDQLKTVIKEKITVENLALIGEFSSFIMHDLKNPITGISLLAQGIDENVPDNDDLKEYTTELLIATKKIENFLKAVLSLSRPQELYLEPVNINELLNLAVDEFNWGSIHLVTRMDESIPVIKADGHLYIRAISNILTNARDAVGENGRIMITTFQTDNMICTSIEDDGKGIPEEKLDTIFRPFFTEKSTGHGLGLAMVKRTAIAHNGDVIVQSEQGKYTRFTFSVPKNL